jgi:hypothetical protein
MTIRKTIRFHEENDREILDYIFNRVERGGDFSAIAKGMLLQIVTLEKYGLSDKAADNVADRPIQAADTLADTSEDRQTTWQTRRQTDDEDDFADPFADLLKD